MQSAGLPVLPGKPPFGGPILSHDFVEASLLRRAGWAVLIADDLEGSYEECPGSLIDLAVRDRRWCQGNFQHARILGAKGLHLVSRLHLATGIFTYLASPVWLLFLMTALGLGVQNEFARPEYFTRAPTLFPLWPHLDPVRALHLFGITLGILLGPKLLGLLWFLGSARRLRGAGLMLPFSFAFEVVLSALVAPILMLIHCGVVVSVLRGHDSGWRPQRRADDSLPWSQSLRRHRWHVVMGVLLAAAGLSVSWQMLAWLAPAVAGMLFAVPLSQLSASPRLGRGMRRLGLLRIPEEKQAPAISARMATAYAFYRNQLAQAPDLAAIAGNAELLQRHLALIDPRPRGAGDAVDTAEATAEFKIREADSLEAALARLTGRERAVVLEFADLLLRLARLPRRTGPEEHT